MSINVGATVADHTTLTPSPKALTLTAPGHAVTAVSNNATNVTATQPSLSLTAPSHQINEEVIVRPGVNALTLGTLAPTVDFTPVQGDVVVDASRPVMTLSPISPGIAAGFPEINQLNQVTETPEQIAIEATVTGTVADDVAAVIEYRLSGGGAWTTAHPLYRHNPGGGNDSFRGCIFDLTPGSTYEIRVTYSDGTEISIRDANNHGTFTTRSLPASVSSQTPDYTPSTITALRTAIASASPGDIIEIQNGSYTLTSDIFVDCNGTLGSEIYIRGETQPGVEFTVGGNEIFITGNYLVFENLTITGTATGSSNRAIVISEGSATNTDITIRDIVSTGTGSAVRTAGGASGAISNRVLLYNCSFTGPAAWNFSNITENTYWSHDGLRIVGSGNCVWNNNIEGFGDSVTFSHSVSDPNIYANYAYRNLIRNSVDDCFEFDYSYGLMAAYDNYCENIRPLMSMDPVNRGPVYCFRNVAVNIATRPFKLNSAGTGYLIYNNTMLRAESAEEASTPGYSWGWSKLNASTQDRIAYRNNILIYTQGLVSGFEIFRLRTMMHTSSSSTDWTHNAHWPDIQIQWEDDAGQDTFTGLADAQANIRSTNPLFPVEAGLGAPTSRHANDVISELQPFETAITLGSDAVTEVTGQTVPTLSSGTTPKNAGVFIPSITDGYSGAAPDMGAIIEGRPPVNYGYTPIGNSAIEQKIATLSAGDYADFNLADGGFATPWNSTAVATQTSAPVYYIPNGRNGKRELHFAGKPQSGASILFSHYVYDIDSNTVTRTFSDDLGVGGTNGHLWGHACDPVTGDFFIHNDYNPNIDHILHFDYSTWDGNTDTWTFTRSANVNTQLGLSLTALTNANGIGWHPNLFGSGVGGIVVYGTTRMFAWRPDIDQWYDLGTHGQPTDRNTGGKGVYLPTADELIIGTGQGASQPVSNKALIAVSAGSGGTPGTFSTRAIPPIQICGSSSQPYGSLMNDPYNEDHMLIGGAPFNAAYDFYWRSTDGGVSWVNAGDLPLNDAGFNDTNGHYLSGRIFGAVIFLSSQGNGGQGSNLLWKPN